MRKITVLFATIAFVFTVGFVFTEESTAASTYNGITYFDPGTVWNCGNMEQTSPGEAEATVTLFNGITYFGASAQRSGAKGSCFGIKAEEGSGTPLYNGITKF